MVPDRVGVSLPGGWVLLSPSSVRHCDRALALAVRAHRRDHLPLPAEVRALLSLLASASETSALPVTEVLAGAEGSRSRRLGLGSAASSTGSPPSLVDAGSAARLLGITDRGVRDLCSRGALQAEKVAGRWLIERADLAEYAQVRDAREAGRSDESYGVQRAEAS
jgi:excisionase family DNA binding protein